MAPVTAVDANAKIDEQEAVKTAVEYAPIYALGNLCIGWYRRFSYEGLLTNIHVCQL